MHLDLNCFSCLPEERSACTRRRALRRFLLAVSTLDDITKTETLQKPEGPPLSFLATLVLQADPLWAPVRRLAAASAEALLLGSTQDGSTVTCCAPRRSKELVRLIVSSKLSSLTSEAISLATRLLQHQTYGWFELSKDFLGEDKAASSSDQPRPEHIVALLHVALSDPANPPQLHYQIAQTLLPVSLLQEKGGVQAVITPLLCSIDPFLLIPAFLPRLDQSQTRELMKVRRVHRCIERWV